MSFWSWLLGTSGGGETPNSNGPLDYVAGDPDGLSLDGDWSPTFNRLGTVQPSPWSGWPAEWNVPQWDFGSRFNELVDIAWTCLDLNSSVLSAMPVYMTKNGRVVPPASWMGNPDPSIYSCWPEFAKQLFWDYQMGEAFVLPVSVGFDGYPLTFRVVPPWMMHAEMRGGRRVYALGGPAGPDVTDEVLHIRYKSSTDCARGVGPLEVAGGRMLTAGILAKYVREVVSTGGLSGQTLETDQELDDTEAQDLLNQWVASRAKNLGAPPVLDNAVKLVDHQTMSPKDMAMIEIAQFTEARIAVLLGVPPTIVAMSSGDSETYKNVSQLFDFHDRASLKVKATHVMSALSWWGLPRGTNAELNRDEYTRGSFSERADAWVKLKAAGLVTTEDFRTAERFTGPAPAQAITGDTPGAATPAQEGATQ